MSIEYIEFSKIKMIAQKFLDEHWAGKKLPVPVDLFAEKIGIDIIPGLHLMKNYGIDALISRDLMTITVDRDIYENQETRYRFSIAHELGHCVLHANFYKSHNFNTIEEWIETYKNIDDKTYASAEYQANCFGGMILMPDEFLIPLFDEMLSSENDKIDLAKQNGIPRDDYRDIIVKLISMRISRTFNVSQSAMQKRLKTDKSYYNKIP